MSFDDVPCENCPAWMSVDDACYSSWTDEDGDLFCETLCPACAGAVVARLQNQRHLDRYDAAHLHALYETDYLRIAGVAA